MCVFVCLTVKGKGGCVLSWVRFMGFFLSLFADRYGGRCFEKHFEKLLENNSAEVEM